MLGLGGNGMNPGAQCQPESGRSQPSSRGHCVFLLGSALAHARSSAYPRQGCFLSPTAVETATHVLPRLRFDFRLLGSSGQLTREASTKPGEICLWDGANAFQQRKKCDRFATNVGSRDAGERNWMLCRHTFAKCRRALWAVRVASCCVRSVGCALRLCLKPLLWAS